MTTITVAEYLLMLEDIKSIIYANTKMTKEESRLYKKLRMTEPETIKDWDQFCEDVKKTVMVNGKVSGDEKEIIQIMRVYGDEAEEAPLTSSDISFSDLDEPHKDHDYFDPDEVHKGEY